MWHTSLGLRTLQGTEARLICETVGELVDAIRAEKDFNIDAEFGIPLFDEMIWQQKLVMLRHVFEPLVVNSAPPCPRTALYDSTVAAIYAQILTGVECEIDMQRTSPESEEGDTDRRQLIIQAIEEHGSESNWPHPECVVVDEWELVVEEVKGWMLADQDYLLDTLDVPPDVGQPLKQLLGISPDYFTHVPPDADDEQGRTAWADILELIDGRRPDEKVF